MEKIGSGMKKIRIRDKHPGSATLVVIGSYLPSLLLKQTERLRYHTNLSLSLQALCASGTVTGVGGDSFNQGTFSVFFFVLRLSFCLDLEQIRYCEFFLSNL
jgi:hypothetical protein